jgi:hypothetical protein
VPVYPVHERNGMVWTTLSENPLSLPEDDEPVVALRSLYLGCGVEAAVAALSTSRLVPFASETPADTTVSRMSDTLFAISCAQDRLLVGVQAISNARTALHLSIVGSAERYNRAGQSHFNDWALQWRHAMERARVAEPRLDQDVA